MRASSSNLLKGHPPAWRRLRRPGMQLRLLVPELWRRRGVLNRLLLPLSWLYAAVVRARRAGYRHGLLRVARFKRPVIVVGGLSGGGSGKTPVVIYVVRLLLAKGYAPGVVSRGYGGAPRRMPLVVGPDTPPDECGDEPAMLARALGVPVVVDVNRPRGVSELISALGCDVVVSDDGLQHYAMDRRVEIVVVGDGASLGNRYCLPAGPLREPLSRLNDAAMVVGDGGLSLPGPGETYPVSARAGDFKRVNGGGRRKAAEFDGHRVHAVAGTGNPAGFFAMLAGLGLEVVEHSFPDHHVYEFRDFESMGDAPIVMTEKDAVKCTKLPLVDAWFVPISVRLDERFDRKLLELLAND